MAPPPRRAPPTKSSSGATAQDVWHQDAYGLPLYQVYRRVFGVVIAGIAKRQLEAKKQLEDARLKAEPPPEPGTVDEGTFVEFVASDGRRGLPAKLLLSTRRAIERGMHLPKAKCLGGWPKDTIWVRVKVGQYFAEWDRSSCVVHIVACLPRL
ncbi:hypothetical protein NUW54_g11874 [Trametes sanguinea]|uniref:Uncharacterized protein n=1 Tax=Trametes sanguinea TaxID=158606 RepID=A0ACC1N657_9APHY|nr:hypothetical protein NUW54_g11874 [Trametes sanguinea]